MILIKSSFEMITVNANIEMIEKAGRVCYKSESKITDQSSRKFIQSIIKSGHESVIEHSSITVKIICDRGVTHEIVRHRLASYSQESTRYCNYSGGVTFIIPPWVNIEPGEYKYDEPLHSGDNGAIIWAQSMWKAEADYQALLNRGWTPQQARSVLPNSLKTEIVMTCNLREWRHFFKLRTAKQAHPQMREITIPMLAQFKILVPIIFDDILFGEEK